MLESQSPGHVLQALDRFAELVPGAAVSTVFCAVIDREGRPSGTAAPATRRRSSCRPTARLAARGGGLAAVGRRRRPRPAGGRRRLPDGATLLLYTDGLVERRNEAIDEGTARAVEVLRKARRLGAPQLADVLTDRLLADAPDDDVAFLLYRCG